MALMGHSVLVADETNDREERRPTLVLVTGLPGTGSRPWRRQPPRSWGRQYSVTTGR
jgi:hypothetical protein